RALSVQLADGSRAAPALAALAEAGIEVRQFSLGQPSLDEVFFALTGHPAEHAAAEEEETEPGGAAWPPRVRLCSGRSIPRSRRPCRGGMRRCLRARSGTH